MKEIAIDLFPAGGFQGPVGGPLSNPQGGAIAIFTKFLSATIGFLTIVAILWFLFLLITGSIGIMTAGGDKASLENSRKKITNGIIGLILVIAATFILNLIGTLIGIPDILNLNYLFGLVSNVTTSGANSPR